MPVRDTHTERERKNEQSILHAHQLKFTVGSVCACVCTDLPPVKVLLIENLQNVSTAEAEPGFLTGNQVIMGWVIVEVALHKGLK